MMICLLNQQLQMCIFCHHVIIGTRFDPSSDQSDYWPLEFYKLLCVNLRLFQIISSVQNYFSSLSDSIIFFSNGRSMILLLLKRGSLCLYHLAFCLSRKCTFCWTIISMIQKQVIIYGSTILETMHAIS